MIVGPHHRVMCETIDRVLRGEISRLIINVPPRYTKTEAAVVHLVAHGLALNPASRYIHASFNGPLALLNSTSVKDVLRLPAYRQFWHREPRDDLDSKELWRTPEGGGMKAGSAGGPITGFGAGLMYEGPWRFTGALIIDDPLKPKDAPHETMRKAVNDNWNATFASRLATEDVPVIVIMQRLHVDDFSGFLLKGGAGCKWHHLLLPVLIDSAAEYPAEFTHGIPIDHGLPDGPLWPYKHNAEQIEALRHDEYTFAGQYMQVPVVSGGNLFNEEWLRGYDELPKLEYRMIYADTAMKDGERNDYSVFQLWGKGTDGLAYLIDQVRGKWKAPELESVARAFWWMHADMETHHFGVLRAMKIEDKSSGTGLIQTLSRPYVGEGGRKGIAIPVVPIQRDKDKVQRANDALPQFACGNVRLPTDAPWYAAWKSEMLAFPNGSHDDQVDPTCDAVSDMLVNVSNSRLVFG